MATTVRPAGPNTPARPSVVGHDHDARYDARYAPIGGSGGGGGADATYTHTQTAPASTWAITHNLGKFPAIDVVDTGGSVVIPDVHYDSANAATLTFGSPTSGKAYCN